MRAIAVLEGVNSTVSSASLSVTPVAANHLVFSKQPANAVAGAPISPAPTVSIVNSTGVPVSGNSSPITVSVGEDPGDGILNGSTSVTARNGVATFPGLSITTTGKGYTLIASSPGLTPSSSRSFNVVSRGGVLPGMTFSLPSSSIGVGASLAGSITLRQAAGKGGVTVSLASSAPRAVTIAPATLKIAAGQSTGSFTYRGVAAGAATLTATASGYTNGAVQATAVAQTTIAPLPGMTFSLPSSSIGVGATLAGSIKLDQAAGKGGVTVSLASNTPSAVTITPATLKIASGQSTGSFSYRGVAAGTATFTATAAGYGKGVARATAVAQAIAPLPGMTFSLPSSSIGVGATLAGSLTLGQPAGKGGVTVSLASGTPSAITIAPATLKIAAGQSTGSFTYSGVAAGAATLTATAAGYGKGVAQATAVAPTIAPLPGMTFYLPSTSIGVGATLAGGLTLGQAAGTGGVTVSLASSTPSAITIAPATLNIAAGQSAGSFTYSGVAAGTVTLTATAAGYGNGVVQATAVAQTTPSLPGMTLSLPSSSIGVGATLAGSITLGQAAGTGGVTVSLASGTPSAITIAPATLNIAAGQSTGSFTYSGVAAGAATLTATAAGYGNGAAQATAVAQPIAPLPAMTFTLPNASIGVGATLAGSITLGQAAGTGGVTVSLASSTPSAITIAPATLNIAAGQSTGSFSYSGVAAGAATLTATAAGYGNGVAQATAVVPSTAAIPATFFGLTVGNFEYLTPTIPFGTARSWESFPPLDWADNNPSPGVYNFATLDNFIAVNQARGAEMIYTLGRTPQWASSQPNAPGPYGPGQCAPPSDLSNWDNYVNAIVTHVAGKIKYWELWNEPNDPKYYCGDIPTMVTMAQHAAQIIKSIDPTALVLSPASNSTSGPAWLSTFLADGGAGAVDVIAFHGYSSTTAEDILTVIANNQAAMQANGAGSKPMWDTEASWAGSGLIGTPPMAVQVGFISKYYLLQWSQGVSRFVWYAYDGGPIWGGLWTLIGGPSPAATAYNETYNWMVGASLTSPCSENANNIWTCSFTRPGGYQAEAVWISGSTATFAVPSQFTEYRDLTGAVYPLTGQSVTIGDQPILLESGALPAPSLRTSGPSSSEKQHP